MDSRTASTEFENSVDAALESIERNSVGVQIPVFVTLPNPVARDYDLARAEVQEGV